MELSLSMNEYLGKTNKELNEMKSIWIEEIKRIKKERKFSDKELFACCLVFVESFKKINKFETFFEDIVAEPKKEMGELLSQFAFDYQIPIAHADSLMTITELVKEFLKKEGDSE